MMGSGGEERGGEGGGSEFVPPQYMQTFVKFRVFIKERYLCSFTTYHLLVSMVIFQILRRSFQQPMDLR